MVCKLAGGRFLSCFVGFRFLFRSSIEIVLLPPLDSAAEGYVNITENKFCFFRSVF